MKLLRYPGISLSLAVLTGLLLGPKTASANPFASCLAVTNGTVQFYLNEGGGTVTVTYEDGSTNGNFNGLTNFAAGLYLFNLTNNSISHTGYAITCNKIGTGTPFQISADANPYSVWSSPRGVDANKNAANGAYFGRVYVGESASGGSGGAFKGQGIYMLTPDLSTNLAAGGGTNALAGGVFTSGNSSSPYRLSVGPDNNIYVADYSTPNATVFSFDPTFSQFTNVVLNPVGEVAGFNAGVHGDPTEVFTSGSLAHSNLVVYTFDPDLPISTAAALFYVDAGGNNVYNMGSEGHTIPGSFNNIYKYNIGAGPLPWTHGPDKGACVGLPSFQDSQIGSVTVEPNGYVVAEFNRANYSDGDIQVYDTNFNLVYTSLQLSSGTDPFNAGNGYGYAGVRVSPDGQYLLTVTSANQINVCYLVNGIPDTSSMIKITTSPNTTFSRGCAFDAADNILYVSSGQGLLRYYSLGYTSTCVTSNDITGTNGTFSVVLPNVRSSLAITQPAASQNYINNPATPGTPTPAAFTITLNTNHLNAPLTVNFSLSGNATYNVNYTLNVGTNPDGVIINQNSVVFPAGAYPGGGNWTATVLVTPTATPLSGPTYTLNVLLAGGPSYIPAEPVTGQITIFNTGPQQLILSAITSANTMTRATPNDYAEFIITRYGDLSAGSYTVTNFTLSGTGVFPLDYTAGPQNLAFPPQNGTPGIVISPGASSFTNIIGNPVARANVYQPPTNVTVTISLTNAVTGTNNTSSEGAAYTVGTGSVTLTEWDNAIGNEIVLWSNPLTNAWDSTNWTLTFATSRLGTNTVLPVVLPNYTNGVTSVDQGGTNDFSVYFGNPIANDNINPSPVMAANGWTTALKASVNNAYGAVAGVNVLPQGVNFKGNYALRFSLYLRLYDFALANPYYSGVADRQFALLGINNRGTNCDWRPTTAVVSGQGSGVTNWDGQWFAIDAGTDSQTPADFDAFTPASIPNAGGNDLVDTHGWGDIGLFKSPPFDAVQNMRGTFGGQAVDQWVDVSAETFQTNIAVYVNRSPVFGSFANTSMFTNGTIMLGYECPLPNLSDGSAYAYFSNVRVVELAPFILSQPVSVLATNGQTVTLSSTATYASAPLTNVWYSGTTPVIGLLTNSVNDTNLMAPLTLTNVQSGGSYLTLFADAAGSVTGKVAGVEVVSVPANIAAHVGDTVKIAASVSGPSAPSYYQWKLSGASLVNNTHFAGVNSASLTITNVQLSDSGAYAIVATNSIGNVTNLALLTVTVVPTQTIAGVSFSGTNVLMSFTTTDTSVTAQSFYLLSSPNVTGPYATNAAAIVTGEDGAFQVTVPKPTNSTMFYRIYNY